MPIFDKSEDWLLQSSLLLEARPATTRITTRYTIAPARRQRKSKGETKDQTAAPESSPSLPPRGTLELKTFDPSSGVTLKYHTTKAQEVGRLIQMLGGPLGRRMAGLPVKSAEDEEVLPDAPPAAEGEGSGVRTPAPGPAAGPGPAEKQGAGASGGGGGGGGGGKGKKKKGKR